MKKKIIFGLVLCALLSVVGIYPVKDVKAAGGYTKEQITQYIIDGEYPTEEGKIFAGWYNGETPVKSTSDVTDTTVPKFVDDDVLTMKFQLLAVTTATSTTTDVRFLTSVDSLNYKSVEFEVTLNKTVTTPVNKVYTSVNAEGEKFTPKEVFSEDSNYIATLLMTDFTKESSDSDEYGYWGKTITVTPKWTTMDGTTVTGKTRQIEVNDGLYETEVNYGSTRTWHTLAYGITKVKESTEDVTIDLLQDVSITSNLTFENTNGKNITLNGNRNKATVTAPILMYQTQTKGTVEVNDLVVDHTKNILFRIGKKDTTYPEKLTVNFNNLDIKSSSTQTDNGLIQAGYVAMNLDMNMTGVKLEWTSTSNINTGAITSGNVSTPTLNLTMNACNLDVSNAPGAKVIYAKTGVTGAIDFEKTTVTTSGVNVIEDGDMTLSIDKDSKFYHGETQSVALVDGVQYSGLDDAISAVNGKTSDTAMHLVQDVTRASQIEINVEGNQSGTITINGSGHTLTGDFEGATQAHFIYFEKHLGTVNLNNITIEHRNTDKNLMTFGAQDAADTDTTVTVNLQNVTMNSESANAYSVINAPQLTNFDITLDRVNLNWKTTQTADTTRAAIRYGNSGSSRTVNLAIIDSTLNMSGALDSGIVYAKNGFNENSTISVQNSVITPYAGQKAYKEYAKDFAPVVYMNKNGYTTLADAVAVAKESEEDITLTLWNNISINSNLTLKNVNGKNIVLDGDGHTATVTAPLLIYQEHGLVEIKNLVVDHTKNILFRIGDKNTTYSNKLTVNLENLDITSKSTQSKGLIQAGFASLQLDLNMTNVDLVWEPDGAHAKGAITAGNADTNATPTLNLTMTGCEINTSAATDGYGVYVESAVTGNLVLNDTTITSNKDSVYDQKMKFTRNTGTVLSTYPTTQIQVGDVVYNELSEAVVDANNSEEDVTIKFLTDVTYSTNITINNVKGNKITIDGDGKKLKPDNAVIFIYQKSGSVEVKNMVVTDYKKNILFRIGDKDSTESYALTVNLENIDITSGSNNPLIQAGHTTMNLTLNMKDVNLLSWTTTSDITTGAIMIGTNGEPTVDLKMEDCLFDVSGANGSAKAVYANDNASGTINLINTKITSKEDSVHYQNMKFTRDTDTELSTYPATQIQVGTTVYTNLSEAVAAANNSQEDVTISFLSDTVTFDENVDIANANGKTITIDGCNKTVYPVNAAIRIYQKSGVVEVKNMVVPNHEKSVLFRIGDRGATYSNSDKLTVNLENLDVTSTSNQSKGLIQAGYGAMQLDLNMKNVDLVWKPTDTHAKGAITIGCDQLTATMLLNLTMTNCTLDVSEATNGCAIYVEDNATGEIHLIGTNITTAVGEGVYNNNIPVYDADKEATVLFEGSQFCEVLIEDVAAQEFARYTETLEERGFTEHSTKKIDNAEYGVYTNDEMALYVNQFDSAMRIVYSDIETAFLPETSQPTFDKVCNTKGYMVGVTAGEYENGMCFIYLLADGTFLVYDGGRNEADADHLYELLHRIAGQHGINEVVISNWMLTHAHGDHSGCLKEFFAKYADSVEIQRVMFNPSHPNLSVDVDRREEKNVLKAIQTYSPDTKIVKLHSGQEFWLADMKVEVLYTIEDLAPGTSDDYNDTSTITRLTINGKTILMTGDAATDVWELMCNIYGDALKSDYLQVPHHGTAPGGTTDAYDKIQPTYLLWPCGDNLYEDNLGILKNWYTNTYLLNMVDSKNSYIAGVYDATNNTERIPEFPFSD